MQSFNIRTIVYPAEKQALLKHSPSQSPS